MAGAPWDDFAEVDDKPTQEAGPWQDYAPKADSGRPSGPWSDYAAASSRPGFLSTIGQAGLKGLKEGVSETADVVDPFKDRPQAPDTSYIGKILEKPVSEGWNDPNWWAAHIAYGGAKSAPSLATGAAGALAGSSFGPAGTLAGAAGGFGLGSVIQTLAPAYQRARQEGLEHDEAVTRAMEQAGIAGAAGAAMGAAPAFRMLKGPISEALLQVFGVQPGIGAAAQVATGATEGKMPSADDLGTGYAENVGLGLALTGAHAGARRLTAREAPALAAEEHPVPAGGVQTAPETVPESRPRDHQVGYDLETNTFKVVGPEGETVKAGFSDDAQAETAARQMDGARNEEVHQPDLQTPVSHDTGAVRSDREMESPPAVAEDAAAERISRPLRDKERSPRVEAEEARDVAEPVEGDQETAPRDWAEIAVPLAAKESGVELTPWQEHQAQALVRNGMDSTEAVKRVTDIPFESRRGINDTRNPGAVQSDRRVTGAVKRGAEAMIDRLRLQAGLDESANRRAERTGVGERTPVDRGDIREIEGFIDWMGHELFANKGLRFRSGATESANGMYDHASRVVTLFRNAVSQGDLSRVGIHELWHSVEENLPAEERPRVYREFNRLRDKYIKANPWASDLLTNPRSSIAGETGSLYGSAAAKWLERWGNDPEAMAGVRVDESPEWRSKPVHIKWDDKNYRYKNPSEFFAETMTDKYAEHQDIQDAKTKSIVGHLRDIYRRITNGIKRAFGYDATGRIFDRFGNREYGAHTGTGETLTSGEALRSLNPEAPRVAPEGRNPMDATSDAIAEAVGGKGAGTYDRAMDRLRPKAGSELKNLNPVENFTIFPDTLAKTDKMFARLWNAWKGRERAEHTHITGWRELIPELRNAKRGDPDVQKAYAAIELHAINREKAMPGQKVRVRNVDTKKATKSKPGEDYTLTPRQEKIYHELNALHDAEWDTMMKATAEKYGWKGAPTAAALANAARGATKSEARQLGRLAELLHLMAQQKQQVYFPRSRFGDTFISVRPKAGQEKDSLGGFPELAHFETVERPWHQDVLGKSGRPDVSKRIAELRKEYPETTHEIETGLLQKRPDMLRRLDIPAVEKLLALTEHKARQMTSSKMKAREGLTAEEAKAMAKEEHAAFKDDMLDTLRDIMYQEMKSGFKKKARIVPGYSPDFDRSVGTHMHQMARHAADLAHREGIDRAYQDIQDKHEHETTKKWVRDWRQFQDDPNTPLGRAANGASQIGYVWTLAMNPSSTLVNLFDIPQSAIPSLAVGNGLRASLAHMGPALAEAYRHTTFNLKQGAHIALEKLGRTPDEKAFIQALKNDGSIHSVSVDDMRELGGRQAEAYGEIKSTMRRAMDIATSNMSVMDQANRAAVALSFYRMAKDPAKLAKMAEAWGGNQKFRDAVEYNGLNPETMARFGLSEAAYEWGRSNKARVMRGPLGTAMFTLHGYQTRFLSNALKLMKNMGPAGKIAAGWMMAGIWAGAGIEGLPFAQDMENLGDVVWKTLTKHDPMISYRLRDALSQAGLGKIGAEIVMRGPLSTLTGTDVANRIGFGDALSREWSGITSGTDVLGTVPSIMFGRLAAAWRREQTRQGHAAAAAELLPAALRNPARAAIEADQGLKTQKGKLVTPASKIGPADLTKIGMGFRPLAQERAYEHKDYGYRAKRAHGTVPHDAIPRSGE